jgi:hypothetical protein
MSPLADWVLGVGSIVMLLFLVVNMVAIHVFGITDGMLVFVNLDLAALVLLAITIYLVLRTIMRHKMRQLASSRPPPPPPLVQQFPPLPLPIIRAPEPA